MKLNALRKAVPRRLLRLTSA